MNTAVLRNDFLLFTAKVEAMRVKQIIRCCPQCMQDDSVQACAVCRPRSAFPSAFSSQAEWDGEPEGSIDIPLLASKIELMGRARGEK